MARLALALAVMLSVRARADEGCAADGTCQADEAEASALLQSSAARRADVAQHGAANATTETTTLTCYPNYAAATCGGAMKCFQDTTGCTTSGGGVCCKAAGNGQGLAQCKYCGDATCGPCPGGPAPTPAPPPSCRTVNQQCGNWGSTGQWQGSCCSGLVCELPPYAVPGASKVCSYPPRPTPAPTPSGNQVGEKCGSWGSTGQYYGQCASGLVCAPPANSMPGTANVCANVCGSFGSDGDSVTAGCNRMQSCKCRATLPCSPWKPGAEGCYMYCC
ncbi:unnamed protein product [Prorocentrum cordatum]|uniref:Cellulase n=1 Tax=Prorocentrum cordatum TaxID=2364126 RepID=A0ABN9UUG7_9DINO|nr:unnamed protein product [Polarella glacialis]